MADYYGIDLEKAIIEKNQDHINTTKNFDKISAL